MRIQSPGHHPPTTGGHAQHRASVLAPSVARAESTRRSQGSQVPGMWQRWRRLGRGVVWCCMAVPLPSEDHIRNLGPRGGWGLCRPQNDAVGVCAPCTLRGCGLMVATAEPPTVLPMQAGFAPSPSGGFGGFGWGQQRGRGGEAPSPSPIKCPHPGCPPVTWPWSISLLRAPKVKTERGEPPSEFRGPEPHCLPQRTKWMTTTKRKPEAGVWGGTRRGGGRT